MIIGSWCSAVRMKLAKPDMLHSLCAGLKVMVRRKQANTAQKQKSMSVNCVPIFELQFSATMW